jgi:hypothetical protein
MSIYSNGTLYGIKINRISNDFDRCETLLEIKQDTIMNEKEKRNVHLFYVGLENKEDIHFQMYTECSTNEDGNFMTWFPISKSQFSEYFY